MKNLKDETLKKIDDVFRNEEYIENEMINEIGRQKLKEIGEEYKKSKY